MVYIMFAVFQSRYCKSLVTYLLSKAAKCLFIGVNTVVIENKDCGGKLPAPLEKNRKTCTEQESLDPSTISALLSAKLYNQS